METGPAKRFFAFSPGRPGILAASGREAFPFSMGRRTVPPRRMRSPVSKEVFGKKMQKEKTGKQKKLDGADIKKLEDICARHRKEKGAVISILQEIQDLFGYIPEDCINFVADRLEMPEGHFYGVATFYSQFHFEPRGKNIITVCCGTACHVKGSGNLISLLDRELGIPEGQETSANLNFTLEKVNCVGACSIAPVVIINKTVHGKTNADRLTKEVKKLRGGEDGKQG